MPVYSNQSSFWDEQIEFNTVVFGRCYFKNYLHEAQTKFPVTFSYRSRSEHRYSATRYFTFVPDKMDNTISQTEIVSIYSVDFFSTPKKKKNK